MSALIVYEYLLTLSNEVTLLWASRLPSAASSLYLFLRSILLAIAGTTIAGNYVPVTTETVGILHILCSRSDIHLAVDWVRAFYHHACRAAQLRAVSE